MTLRFMGMMLLFSGGAFAQSASVPTDSEIAAAHAECDKPENHVGIGSMANRPLDLGQYKPEWRERCLRIDTEYEKRQIKKRADDKAAHDRMDDIINRLPK